MVTASSISPSGMQIAGKYGMGVLSIASHSTEGILALPTQWGFAEEAAAANGHHRRSRQLARVDGVPHRRDPRAGPCRGRRRAAPLAQRVQRAGPSADPARRTSTTSGSCSTSRPAPMRPPPEPRSSGRPTTSSPRSATCRSSRAGSAWSSASPTTGPTARRRCARGSSSPRYVFPEFDGSVTRLRASQQYLHDNQADLMAGASRAVMAKVMAHEGAAAAMGVTMERLAARQAAGTARDAVGVPSRRRTPRASE